MTDMPIKYTRQVYSAAIEIIGVTDMTNIYGPMKQRQFYHGAADPRHCEETLLEKLSNYWIRQESIRKEIDYGNCTDTNRTITWRAN